MRNVLILNSRISWKLESYSKYYYLINTQIKLNHLLSQPSTFAILKGKFICYYSKFVIFPQIWAQMNQNTINSHTCNLLIVVIKMLIKKQKTKQKNSSWKLQNTRHKNEWFYIVDTITWTHASYNSLFYWKIQTLIHTIINVLI